MKPLQHLLYIYVASYMGVTGFCIKSKKNMLILIRTNLFCILSVTLFFVLCACRKLDYSGYLMEAYSDEFIDSVLITDNYNAAKAWLDSGVPFPEDKSLLLYTDRYGFFSFRRSCTYDDRNIYFIKNGYNVKSFDQRGLHGDTIYISPDRETLAAREKEKEPKYITSTHQLPLQIGDMKFVLHQERVHVCISDTSIPVSHTYNAIYIDENRKSEKYEQALNFRLVDDYYFPSSSAIKHKLPASLPRKWVPLEQYEGKYYIYRPAVRSISQNYEIADTTLICFGFPEGAYGFAYSSIEHHKDHYIFKDINKEGNTVFWDELHIYIIDRARGLAVFEGREKGEIYFRSLYVTASKVRNFPLIIQEYSGTEVMKPQYFPLDEIDFDKLLEGFKK